MTSFYSSNSFTTFRTKIFSRSLKKVFFLAVTSIFSKSSKSLFQFMVMLGKKVCLVKINITYSDYQHAVSVYNDFGCQKLGDYHDVYLKTDVPLSADIFEKFRSVCLNAFRLDPSHFYSAPKLSWESMLNSTKVKLGLLQDLDMLLIFRRGFRGGVNGVGELRQFTANNAHLDNFHPRQKTTLGAFYDVTSLYAGTMQEMMPVGNNRWNKKIAIEQILQKFGNSSVRYFVEVDLKYPQYLHYLHNGLPSAPGKLIIRSRWLSPFAKSSGIKPNKTPKLVETLLDKKHYVCHYENLKIYVKHGLVVDKIHCVRKYEQSKWLGVYIEKDTIMRKQAKNDFEKKFYKLMSNACFVKTVENLRKRSVLKMVSNPQQGETIAQRATSNSFQIIRHDLISVSFKNWYVVWTKAAPVGAASLDLSKLSLSKFHYEEMIPRYWSGQLKVAFKDTDSLSYLMETLDLYKDKASFKHLLDLSGYPQDHFLHDPTIKKVPLTMTDDQQSKVLREVVRLRSKSYSIE